MPIVILLMILLGVLVAVELYAKHVAIRLITTICVGGIFIAVSWIASSTLNQYESTLETNNVIKNFTRGMAKIVCNEHNAAVLCNRLNNVEKKIVPSYENRHSARDAVEGFLALYNIKYQAEIPLHENAPLSE